MSRRVIQPPGGSSSIFFGDDPSVPAAKKPDPKAAAPQVDVSEKEAQDAPKSETKPEEQSNGKDVEHLPQPKQAVPKANTNNVTEVQQESAQEAAVLNKARQGTHGYNLITGEMDRPAASKPAASKSGAEEQDNSGKQAASTSIKVVHPPGGKSSGLW